MGKRLFIFFCFYISGLALLLWKSKTNGPTVMESDVRRLKCAKFMNGKLKPAVLLSDPDAPSPQGLSVSESPQFSLLSHESTCEERSCFIKKPFFPCLLILHHNHHGGHLHVFFIFYHSSEVGPILAAVSPPTSSHCGFSGIGVHWLISCWYGALASTCSE